jgi:hypothetical protein
MRGLRPDSEIVDRDRAFVTVSARQVFENRVAGATPETAAGALIYGHNDPPCATRRGLTAGGRQRRRFPAGAPRLAILLPGDAAAADDGDSFRGQERARGANVCHNHNTAPLTKPDHCPVRDHYKQNGWRRMATVARSSSTKSGPKSTRAISAPPDGGNERSSSGPGSRLAGERPWPKANGTYITI